MFSVALRVTEGLTNTQVQDVASGDKDGFVVCVCVCVCGCVCGWVLGVKRF